MPQRTDAAGLGRELAGREDVVLDKVLEGPQDPHLITEMDVVREWVTWLPGGKLFQVEGQQMPELCCTAAHQASLSFTISQSLLKLMSIELVMPSNHLLISKHIL